MDSAEENGGGTAMKDKARGSSRPAYSLPTDRLAFSKQLELLRAYGALGERGAIVGFKEAGAVVKLASATASLANAFFLQNGFLQKQDGGKFLPAPEVIAFGMAHRWNPETAARKLEPLVRESWFGRALIPRLQFSAQPEEEAITILAEACSAGPEYRNQLRTLLDYMKASGVVENNGGQVMLASSAPATTTDREPRQPAQEMPMPQPARQSGAISTAFSQQATEGVIQFHVSVRVDMSELAEWKPDRIASFFAGIAQVLAAKGAIEKGVSEE
jgi:hypothetical protein